jgi:hypothetical protein
MAIGNCGKEGEGGLIEFGRGAQGSFDSILHTMRSIAQFLCMPQERNPRPVSGIETNFTDR